MYRWLHAVMHRWSCMLLLRGINRFQVAVDGGVAASVPDHQDWASGCSAQGDYQEGRWCDCISMFPEPLRNLKSLQVRYASCMNMQPTCSHDQVNFSSWMVCFEVHSGWVLKRHTHVSSTGHIYHLCVYSVGLAAFMLMHSVQVAEAADCLAPVM